MPRRRVLMLAASLAVLALAGVVIGLAARGGSSTAAHTNAVQSTSTGKRSYAQLVAANYKPLTAAQSARLLRFADAAYRCMSKQIDLGKPDVQPTRIVLSLPEGTKMKAVLRVAMGCAGTIGDPPPGSSFQVRPRAVLVYLPKYCILDEKVAKPATG
jgi:hypothetical protein